MKDVINWLMDMEELAGNLYRGAAILYKEDTDLSNFLNRLGADEALHYHLISEALKLLDEGAPPPESIKLDTDTKEQIESPFTASYQALLAGSLTKEELLRCIVETEFSEFNNVFLKIVSMLKPDDKINMDIESELKRHLSDIEEYLGSLPDGGKYVEEIQGIRGEGRQL